MLIFSIIYNSAYKVTIFFSKKQIILHFFFNYFDFPSFLPNLYRYIVSKALPQHAQSATY